MADAGGEKKDALAEVKVADTSEKAEAQLKVTTSSWHGAIRKMTDGIVEGVEDLWESRVFRPDGAPTFERTWTRATNRGWPKERTARDVLREAEKKAEEQTVAALGMATLGQASETAALDLESDHEDDSAADDDDVEADSDDSFLDFDDKDIERALLMPEAGCEAAEEARELAKKFRAEEREQVMKEVNQWIQQRSVVAARENEELAQMEVASGVELADQQDQLKKLNEEIEQTEIDVMLKMNMFRTKLRMQAEQVTGVKKKKSKKANTSNIRLGSTFAARMSTRKVEAVVGEDEESKAEKKELEDEEDEDDDDEDEDDEDGENEAGHPSSDEPQLADLLQLIADIQEETTALAVANEMSNDKLGTIQAALQVSEQALSTKRNNTDTFLDAVRRQCTSEPILAIINSTWDKVQQRELANRVQTDAELFASLLDKAEAKKGDGEMVAAEEKSIDPLDLKQMPPEVEKEYNILVTDIEELEKKLHNLQMIAETGSLQTVVANHVLNKMQAEAAQAREQQLAAKRKENEERAAAAANAAAAAAAEAVAAHQKQQQEEQDQGGASPSHDREADSDRNATPANGSRLASAAPSSLGSPRSKRSATETCESEDEDDFSLSDDEDEEDESSVSDHDEESLAAEAADLASGAADVEEANNELRRQLEELEARMKQTRDEEKKLITTRKPAPAQASADKGSKGVGKAGKTTNDSTARVEESRIDSSKAGKGVATSAAEAGSGREQSRTSKAESSMSTSTDPGGGKTGGSLKSAGSTRSVAEDARGSVSSAQSIAKAPTGVAAVEAVSGTCKSSESGTSPVSLDANKTGHVRFASQEPESNENANSAEVGKKVTSADTLNSDAPSTEIDKADQVSTTTAGAPTVIAAPTEAEADGSVEVDGNAKLPAPATNAAKLSGFAQAFAQKNVNSASAQDAEPNAGTSATEQPSGELADTRPSAIQSFAKNKFKMALTKITMAKSGVNALSEKQEKKLEKAEKEVDSLVELYKELESVGKDLEKVEKHIQVAKSADSGEDTMKKLMQGVVSENKPKKSKQCQDLWKDVKRKQKDLKELRDAWHAEMKAQKDSRHATKPGTAANHSVDLADTLAQQVPDQAAGHGPEQAHAASNKVAARFSLLRTNLHKLIPGSPETASGHDRPGAAGLGGGLGGAGGLGVISEDETADVKDGQRTKDPDASGRKKMSVATRGPILDLAVPEDASNLGQRGNAAGAKASWQRAGLQAVRLIQSQGSGYQPNQANAGVAGIAPGSTIGPAPTTMEENWSGGPAATRTGAGFHAVIKAAKLKAAQEAAAAADASRHAGDGGKEKLLVDTQKARTQASRSRAASDDNMHAGSAGSSPSNRFGAVLRALSGPVSAAPSSSHLEHSL
eukprot:TRINITY_DN28263_c0_g4_i3.p1 TRINITY_DN28263_c0_g4~~TRINITY_DN28263_c0_g4_i3.p1  ORF type:complete len:1375 (+),score=326.10 TRINITY_DN28263_c0_g4_i3:174-4298(+)